MLHRPHRLRSIVLGVAFSALAATVCARLVTLQLDRHDAYVARARQQQTRRVVIQPERGDILDREGRPLAQSTARLSLYVHPVYLRAPHADIDLDQLARQIAHYTGMPASRVRERLDRNTPVVLGRALHPEVARRLEETLDIYSIDARGVWFHRETRRTYPRHLAAPLIGFCSSDGDGDNTGIGGIEQSYNGELGGQRIESKVRRTAVSQSLDSIPAEDLVRARGNTLVLTIDSVIQEATETALREAVEEFGAAGAGAVVMDVRTGDVLAMASHPTFDNNNFSGATAEQRRNRTITDPLEAGSVVKLFTAAMLIDLGLVGPDTLVDCEGGHAVIDGRRINDAPGHEPLHVVPFRTALAFSSNVGIIKLAQAVDNATWYGYLRSFGFGQDTPLRLPGESAGILYPVEKWTKFSRTSLPMGYELALTPIQIAAGVAALVNEGRYMRPTLVKEIRSARGEVIERHEPEELRQVVRPTTSAIMRELMADVVVEGTGKKAQVPGYRIGGKTGTTVKSHIRDRKEYISSFCGVVPIDQPAVVVYVYVDAPTKARFGGTIAAPAFAKIARVAMLHLGVPPTEPIDHAGELELVAAALEQPPPPAPPEGTMPDLSGLSMAEVRRALPMPVASLSLAGSGLACDQSPLPGDPLGPSPPAFVPFPPGRAPPLGRAWAAARIFRGRSSFSSPTEYGPPGFGTTSTAPLRKASMAFSEPLSATELMTITGFGRYCMMRRRKVRPSMRGISISRVMTSGSRSRILLRATKGSGAVPTTVMPSA